MPGIISNPAPFLGTRPVGVQPSVSGFNPLAISGLIGWYDFSDISKLWKDVALTSPVTADNDAVLGVTDKSPGVNPLTDAVGATYKTNIQNGRSVVRCNGTTQSLANSEPARATQTMFWVGRQTSAPSAPQRPILSMTNQSGGCALTTTSATSATNWLFHNDAAAAMVNLGTTSTAYHVMTFKVVSAASLIIRADGTQVASFDPPNSVTTDVAWDIGIEQGTGFGDGDTGEWLVYDSALSDPNCAVVEAYLKARWGTP